MQKKKKKREGFEWGREWEADQHVSRGEETMIEEGRNLISGHIHGGLAMLGKKVGDLFLPLRQLNFKKNKKREVFSEKLSLGF